MNNKSKQYPNPKFTSIEEEEKYWETHSPLDEGFEGEVQTTKQKRSSFLSVRMTGDELSKLRDEAVMMGLGPSTYARLVLTRAITRRNDPAQFAFADIDTDNWQIGRKIGDNDIFIMSTAAGLHITRDMANTMFRTIFNTAQCTVITPDSDVYRIVKPLVETSPQE